METAPKVLALGWPLVATNPQAGVTLLLLMYLHWFKLAAGSRVMWAEQAEVKVECRALYARYKEEPWMRPFNKNFVSFFFLLTPSFVLTSPFRVSVRLRSRLRTWEQRG